MPLPTLLRTVRSSRFALPVAVALGIAALFINDMSYRRAVDTIEANQKVLAGRIEIRRLQLQMLAAETGHRGYLLTGQPEFLRPYVTASAAIETQLDVIRSLYGTQPEWLDEQSNVQRLTRAKLAVLATTLELYDRGRPEAALELVKSGIGLEHMQALESLIGAIALKQQGRMESNSSLLQRTLFINRVGIALLVLFSVLGLAMYLRQARRLEDIRHDQELQLRDERDRLDEQVQLRTGQLTELARHLQLVREEERSHVARELHDELGALLTAAKLDLARIRSKMRDSPADIADRLDHLNDSLNQGVALKRRIIEDLRPSTLGNLGLVAALEILCREFETRAELTVSTSLEPIKLPPGTELTIYRLVQEALTNVAKYAQARRVDVTLSLDDQTATIAVKDDGNGFDLQAVGSQAHGLAGMKFRVETAGGRFELQSSPGNGTLLEATLPRS